MQPRSWIWRGSRTGAASGIGRTTAVDRAEFEAWIHTFAALATAEAKQAIDGAASLQGLRGVGDKLAAVELGQRAKDIIAVRGGSSTISQEGEEEEEKGCWGEESG
jgi:hypothetical protein